MYYSTPVATFFFRGSGISTRNTTEVETVDPVLAARREQIGREMHIWAPTMGILILALIILSIFDRD